MSLHRVIETVFTIIMLLFLAVILLAILVGITIVQQLAEFNVGFEGQFVFVAGMGLTFVYILKLIVDKIKDYNRFNNN